jgi:hypothetical protein
MLPDYPETKSELREFLNDFMRERHRTYLGALSQVPRVRRPEGSGSSQVDEDEQVRETEFFEVSATLTIDHEELPDLTLEDTLKRFDEVARQLAESAARQFYERISQILEDAGQVVSAKGKRFTAETLLEVLSKLDLEFGPDGRPRLPDLHLHPTLVEAAQAALKKLDEDPELRAEVAQLLTEKRLDFRVREADRRLVG